MGRAPSERSEVTVYHRAWLCFPFFFGMESCFWGRVKVRENLKCHPEGAGSGPSQRLEKTNRRLLLKLPTSQTLRNACYNITPNVIQIFNYDYLQSWVNVRPALLCFPPPALPNDELFSLRPPRLNEMKHAASASGGWKTNRRYRTLVDEKCTRESSDP